MIDFEKNTNLVYFVFNKWFKSLGYLKDDLCQEGLIALWQASEKYNQKLEMQFSTYATKLIHWSMLLFLRKKELKHFKNSITFSELEAYDFDCDFSVEYDDTKMQVELLIKSSKQSQRNKDIISDYLFKQEKKAELARKYKISKTWASKIIRNFNNEIKSKL